MVRIKPDWVKDFLKWDGFRFVERRPQGGVRLICTVPDETNQFRLVELCEHLDHRLAVLINKEVTRQVKSRLRQMGKGGQNG